MKPSRSTALEPRRKLGCCASSIECLFFVLNVTILLCSAMFGGFAAYFYVNPDFPAALGMEDVRMILAILGGILALLAITGMLMTASHSSILCKFYQLVLIVTMVSQCVGGVYLMMLQTTSPGRIQTAWNHLSSTGRHLIEVRLMCCGFQKPTESPDCVASRTTSCSTLIMNSQAPLITILSTICLVFAAVEILSLMMAAYLGGQYKKLKRTTTAMMTTTMMGTGSILPTSTTNLCSNSRSTRPSLGGGGGGGDDLSPAVMMSRSGTAMGGWRSKLPESLRQPPPTATGNKYTGNSDTGPL